jgi:hypothetical protein
LTGDGEDSGIKNSIAPSYQDLEEAYRAPDPGPANHQRAEAVLANADGITVLCNVNAGVAGERSLLIRLANDGDVKWTRELPPGASASRAITYLQSGGFALAGAVRRSKMAYRGHLTYTDARGDLVAQTPLGPPGVTGLVCVVSLSDGSTLAGGTSCWKGWLVSANARLHEDWSLTLDDLEDVDSVAPLAEGSFAAVGGTDRSTTRLGLAHVVTFAREGRVRWKIQLPSVGRGELTAVAAFPDGSLAGVGHATTAESELARLWVVRLNPSGEIVWEKRLGPVEDEHRGRTIAALPDGGLALAGEGIHAGRRTARVIRLTVDGTEAWQCAYGDDHADTSARGITPTSDGGLVLAGSIVSGPNKTIVRILKLDGHGRPTWESTPLL